MTLYQKHIVIFYFFHETAAEVARVSVCGQLTILLIFCFATIFDRSFIRLIYCEICLDEAIPTEIYSHFTFKHAAYLLIFWNWRQIGVETLYLSYNCPSVIFFQIRCVKEKKKFLKINQLV